MAIVPIGLLHAPALMFVEVTVIPGVVCTPIVVRIATAAAAAVSMVLPPKILVQIL